MKTLCDIIGCRNIGRVGVDPVQYYCNNIHTVVYTNKTDFRDVYNKLEGYNIYRCPYYSKRLKTIIRILYM